MSSKNLLTFKTRDGEEFKLDEVVVLRSQFIKKMIEDDCASSAIVLSNVDSKTMTKVIEYWKKHSEEGVSKDELKDFDKNFLKVHHSVLYDLLIATDYLKDKELMDVICREVADRINGKSPEEVRKEFDIKNDFTPGEEEEMRKMNDLTSFKN